ncbi:MaoC family dehydratase [Paramicrobacterium chengjingii]|uniref:MaoC family dehydratase n=1 Tax=Paramicrobacterium chengjingii TaxID=2769067 RepID=UPI00142447B0|nr:MaoC family dehydratase [Microbacterium chengjingii]
MATSAKQICVEDLPALVNIELGPTKPVLVSQDRIDGFARDTDDFQWIHTDPVRAAAGPFGSCIAQGFLTLALVSKFLHELIDVQDATAAINYGLNRVRFPSPIAAGDPLSATARVIDVRQNPRGVLLMATVVMTVEGAQKPACVAESLTLYPDGKL